MCKRSPVSVPANALPLSVLMPDIQATLTHGSQAWLPLCDPRPVAHDWQAYTALWTPTALFAAAFPLLVAHWHDMRSQKPASPALLSDARRVARLFWALSCAVERTSNAQTVSERRHMLSLMRRLHTTFAKVFAACPYTPTRVSLGSTYAHLDHSESVYLVFKAMADHLSSACGSSDLRMPSEQDDSGVSGVAHALTACARVFPAESARLFLGLMGDRIHAFSVMIAKMFSLTPVEASAGDGLEVLVSAFWGERGFLRALRQMDVLEDDECAAICLLLQTVTNTLLQHPPPHSDRLLVDDAQHDSSQVLQWLLLAPCLVPSNEDPFGKYLRIRTIRRDRLGDVTLLHKPGTIKLGKLLGQVFDSTLRDSIRLRRAVNATRLAFMRLDVDFIAADDPDGWREAYAVHVERGNCMEQQDSAALYACARYLPQTIGKRQMDIALAVLRDVEGVIRARTIVNQRKGTFVRVYGDRALEVYLEREGYMGNPQSSLDGYFILATHMDQDIYHAPCVDWDSDTWEPAPAHLVLMRCQDADLDAQHRTFWRIGKRENVLGLSYVGLPVALSDTLVSVFEQFHDCHCCHDRFPETMLRPVHDFSDSGVVSLLGHVCQDCFDDNYQYFPTLEAALNCARLCFARDGQCIPEHTKLAEALGYVWVPALSEFVPDGDCVHVPFHGYFALSESVVQLCDGSFIDDHLVTLAPEDALPRWHALGIYLTVADVESLEKSGCFSVPRSKDAQNISVYLRHRQRDLYAKLERDLAFLQDAV